MARACRDRRAGLAGGRARRPRLDRRQGLRRAARAAGRGPRHRGRRHVGPALLGPGHRRGRGWSSASSPASAATSPSGRPAGSRPTSASSSSPTSSACTSRSTTRTQTGQLMSRANTDLQQIQAFVVMIPLTISNAVTVLAVTVILLTIDPLLTVLALGVPALPERPRHPLLPAAPPRGDGDPAGVGRAGRRGRGDRGGRARGEGVRGRAGPGGPTRHRRPTTCSASRCAAARVRARFAPALELLPNIGLIATLGYGGHQVLDGHLLIGQLLAFNLYVVMLIWPLRMLGMIIAQGQRSAASAERVFEVLSTAPAVAEPVDALALPASRPEGRGEVRFEGVRFAYAPSLPAVLDGHRPGGAGRSVGGPRRRDRLGQDHGGPAPPALLRRGRRLRVARRRGRAPAPPPGAPQGGGDRVRGDLPLLPHDRRQHRVRRSRAHRRRRSSAPPASPVPTTSSPPCPRATPPRSASAATRCRAGSGSASPSPGRSSPTRAC